MFALLEAGIILSGTFNPCIFLLPFVVSCDCLLKDCIMYRLSVESPRCQRAITLTLGKFTHIRNNCQIHDSQPRSQGFWSRPAEPGGALGVQGRGRNSEGNFWDNRKRQESNKINDKKIQKSASLLSSADLYNCQRVTNIKNFQGRLSLSCYPGPPGYVALGTCPIDACAMLMITSCHFSRDAS